jgi:transcriptional regulator with XRE-family HTH domain
MKTQWAFNRTILTAKRTKLGLSPEVLGTIIGVTDQTIRNWESGVRGIKGDHISALANFFRISPGAFWMLVSRKPHLRAVKSNKNRTAAATVEITRATRHHRNREQ